MNTPKIAALYASPIFNTLVRFPDFDPTTTLTKEVMDHVMEQAQAASEDRRRYVVDAAYYYRRERYHNDLGRRASGFLEENVSKRVADWMLRQLPGYPETTVANLRPGMPEQDTILVTVFGYGRGEEDTETLGYMRYGAREDFEVLLRGVASIRAKRRKQAKKLEAQLRAYHAQQEMAKLKAGQWLGAEKALTTASRVAAADVPFLGDTGLTYEQRKALGLRYYAIYPGFHGMSAAFPVGTGITIKQVKRSRELVDGAVYLWQWMVNGQVAGTVLGRLDLSAKQRGFLPLRDEDTGKVTPYCWAAWDNENIKIYRVMHYTTRSAQPVATAHRMHSRGLSSADFLALPIEGQRQADQVLEQEMAEAA